MSDIKVPLYSQEGEKVGEHTLSPVLFGVKPTEAVLHQVLTSYRANAREPLAHVKTRAEVRGGGKKPWRQKGTGRARHGSIRSPIWKGGGVAHGPRNDINWTQKINVKLARKALAMALTDKVGAGKLVLVQDIAFAPLKTKTAATLLAKLPLTLRSNKNTSVLLGLSTTENGARRALRNIPGTAVMKAMDLNAYEVAAKTNCILSLKGVEELMQRFSKKAA